MNNGFDCATSLTAEKAQEFEHAGFDFVCRYLAPPGMSKRLTRTEADAVSPFLQIISVYETTASRSLGGREAGLADGAAALQYAAEVGQPPGSTIYFAVDFEAVSGQMETVVEYIRAASEVTPGYNTGVYGAYAVVHAVKAADVCSHFWQTYAWSGGQRADGIQIYQFRNDILVNGIGVDLDQGYGEEGGWRIMPQVNFDQAAAQKVIDDLKALYAASADTNVENAAHYAAEALRDAVGLPK